FHIGIFYSPGEDQISVLEKISQFGMGDQQLPIEKKQADNFFSDVLPSLKKVGDVDIDTNVEYKIINDHLQAKLCLTIEDEYITGKLEYHHEKEQIDPFSSQHQSEYIINRDSEKEQQIMGLIEQANFHYNGKELYIQADDETLYDFIYHVLPLLDKYVNLYLTSEIQNLIIEHE